MLYKTHTPQKFRSDVNIKEREMILGVYKLLNGDSQLLAVLPVGGIWQCRNLGGGELLASSG